MIGPEEVRGEPEQPGGVEEAQAAGETHGDGAVEETRVAGAADESRMIPAAEEPREAAPTEEIQAADTADEARATRPAEESREARAAEEARAPGAVDELQAAGAADGAERPGAAEGAEGAEGGEGAEGTEAAEDADETPKSEPTRILVVDDEEIMREFLREVLSDQGYGIDLAASGQEAVEKMTAEQYDLVLTDIVMPELDGLGVVAAAKKLPYEVDVVVMTGYASMETAVESMKLGASDYITKPFNIDQIRIIVENAIAERALKKRAAEGDFYKELSRKDGLTELYNHRFFHQLLETEISRAERYNRAVSLLMIDIDNFKKYNDTHGHPTGDVILKKLARLLRQSSRSCDYVARYGGEEFAVIAPEAGPDAAGRMAQRIRGIVEETDFEGEEVMVGGRLTISIGVASFPSQATSKSDLVEKSDRALYRAKALGKNRVVLYGEEDAY